MIKPNPSAVMELHSMTQFDQTTVERHDGIEYIISVRHAAYPRKFHFMVSPFASKVVIDRMIYNGQIRLCQDMLESIMINYKEDK